MSFNKENLLSTINTLSNETTEKLNIISLKYDKINSQFNRLTTIVLIISSLVTMTNALFLTLNDTILSSNSNKSRTSVYMNFVGNTLGLLLSTLMTVLTSIIKFRNYRENMEKLKEYQQYLLDINVSLEKERSLLDMNTSNRYNDIVDHINTIKEKLEKQIQQRQCDVSIISDLRFAENETDELAWFKKQNGLHIHLDRLVDGQEMKAPNEFEEKNNPQLREAADVVLKMEYEESLDAFKKTVKTNVENILEKENVKFDVKDLGTAVNTFYPDLRKMINTLQSNTTDGVLSLEGTSLLDANYLKKVLHILQNPTKTSFRDIRQVLAYSNIEDYGDIFKFLYNNLDKFAVGYEGEVTILIEEYQYHSNFRVDGEINFMALISQILKLITNKLILS